MEILKLKHPNRNYFFFALKQDMNKQKQRKLSDGVHFLGYKMVHCVSYSLKSYIY